MTQKTPASPEALARGYKNERGNLLLVVIFTVVNAFMAFMGSSSYFLFSAYLPYYSVIFGLVLTWMKNTSSILSALPSSCWGCICCSGCSQRSITAG